jgi:hypothetical protein
MSSVPAARQKRRQKVSRGSMPFTIVCLAGCLDAVSPGGIAEAGGHSGWCRFDLDHDEAIPNRTNVTINAKINALSPNARSPFRAYNTRVTTAAIHVENQQIRCFIILSPFAANIRRRLNALHRPVGLQTRLRINANKIGVLMQASSTIDTNHRRFWMASRRIACCMPS